MFFINACQDTSTLNINIWIQFKVQLVRHSTTHSSVLLIFVLVKWSVVGKKLSSQCSTTCSILVYYSYRSIRLKAVHFRATIHFHCDRLICLLIKNTLFFILCLFYVLFCIWYRTNVNIRKYTICCKLDLRSCMFKPTFIHLAFS